MSDDLLRAAAQIAADDQLEAALRAHGWDRTVIRQSFVDAGVRPDLVDEVTTNYLRGLFQEVLRGE